MKKLVLILLLGVGVVGTAAAQQYFNIRDNFHSSATVLTSVLERNNKYYVTGVCVDSSNYLNPGPTVPVGAKFAVFDLAGNKIRDTFYQKNTEQIIEPWCTRNLYSMPDGSFIVCAQYTDSSLQKGLIIKFDSIGNKIWEKVYDQPLCNNHNWYAVTDLKPTGTGEWLMLGDITCDINATQTHNTLALTKLDCNFNVIWSKQYGDPVLNNIPGKMLVEPDGYVLTSVRDNTNLVAVNFTSRAELIKTDTAGNQMWNYLSDANKLTYIPTDIIRTQDGGYAYCGSGNGEEMQNETHTYGQLWFKDWVEKIDASRNVVWNKSYSPYLYTELKKVKELPSGNILLFGNKYCPFIIDTNSGHEHTRGWYLKIAANGDSITEHTYYKLRTCNDENLINDVKPTSDGGYIMAGESTDNCGGYQPPHQRGWLVKIDSNGCIDPIFCDQQDTSTEVMQIAASIAKVSVYPNPVNETLQINYGHIADGRISITDMMGRVLMDQELQHSLDVKGLVSGLYIYKVTEKGLIKGQGKILKE